MAIHGTLHILTCPLPMYYTVGLPVCISIDIRNIIIVRLSKPVLCTYLIESFNFYFLAKKRKCLTAWAWPRLCAPPVLPSKPTRSSASTSACPWKCTLLSWTTRTQVVCINIVVGIYSNLLYTTKFSTCWPFFYPTSDVRMTADDALSRAVKNLVDTNVGRLQVSTALVYEQRKQ